MHMTECRHMNACLLRSASTFQVAMTIRMPHAACTFIFTRFMPWSKPRTSSPVNAREKPLQIANQINSTESFIFSCTLLIRHWYMEASQLRLLSWDVGLGVSGISAVFAVLYTT